MEDWSDELYCLICGTAALSAAAIVPPVFGVELPQPELMRPRTVEAVERFRDHPAGRYALALFSDERPRPGTGP